MSEESAFPITTYIKEPNYTQLPNEWLENTLPQINTLAEIKVTLILFRQTFGWKGRKEAQVRLSCEQIAKLTGLTKQSVHDGIKAALARGFVYRIKTGPQAYAYGIQVGPEPAELDVQAPVPTGNKAGNPTAKPSEVADGCTKPSEVADGTVRGGGRLGGESLYMKEKEIKSATRTKNGQSRKHPSFPTYSVEKGMLCPEDFSLTTEMRAWAEKYLPPATLARLDELLPRFIRKRRVEERRYFRDLAACVASWQGYMEICGDNDARTRTTRGGGNGNGRVMQPVDDGPSYDDLVAAGTMPALM